MGLVERLYTELARECEQQQHRLSALDRGADELLRDLRALRAEIAKALGKEGQGG